jgi:hypothetical protein
MESRGHSTAPNSRRCQRRAGQLNRNFFGWLLGFANHALANHAGRNLLKLVLQARTSKSALFSSSQSTSSSVCCMQTVVRAIQRVKGRSYSSDVAAFSHFPGNLVGQVCHSTAIPYFPLNLPNSVTVNVCTTRIGKPYGSSRNPLVSSLVENSD